jgi:hypothetical protein
LKKINLQKNELSFLHVDTFSGEFFLLCWPVTVPLYKKATTKSSLRWPQSQPKVKNLRPKLNVSFVENQISKSIWPYTV